MGNTVCPRSRRRWKASRDLGGEVHVCYQLAVINPLDPGYYCSEELRGFGFKAVGENVRVSKACNVVGPENIEIGDNVRIDAFTSMIAHSGFIKLGSYIHIGTNCLLGARGGISVAGFNAIGHGSRIFSASDDFSGEWMVSCEAPSSCLNVTVMLVRMDRHAVLTTGCTVLPGAVIQEGAVAGAHSVVSRSLEPWTINVGAPASQIAIRKTRALELAAQVRGVLLAA